MSNWRRTNIDKSHKQYACVLNCEWFNNVNWIQVRRMNACENIANGGVTQISIDEDRMHVQIYLAIVCAIREDTIGVWYCSLWSEGSIFYKPPKLLVRAFVLRDHEWQRSSSSNAGCWFWLTNIDDSQKMTFVRTNLLHLYSVWPGSRTDMRKHWISLHTLAGGRLLRICVHT